VYIFWFFHKHWPMGPGCTRPRGRVPRMNMRKCMC
jgi:hypothetical protein